MALCVLCVVGCCVFLWAVVLLFWFSVGWWSRGGARLVIACHYGLFNIILIMGQCIPYIYGLTRICFYVWLSIIIHTTIPVLSFLLCWRFALMPLSFWVACLSLTVIELMSLLALMLTSDWMMSIVVWCSLYMIAVLLEWCFSRRCGLSRRFDHWNYLALWTDYCFPGSLALDPFNWLSSHARACVRVCNSLIHWLIASDSKALPLILMVYHLS